MDTTEHIDRDLERRDYIIESMKMNSDEGSLEFGETRKSHYLYKKYASCTTNGGLFEIKYNDDPRLSWDGYKLIYHLSHFSSFKHFLESLKTLTGPHFNHFIENVKIVRFDFAIDCLRDFDSLYHGVKKAGARTLKLYSCRNGYRTYYIGSIKNSHVKIYEKKDLSQFDTVDDYRADFLKKNNISCRIEQVLKGESLPFKTISEMLNVIWEYEFFKNLSFHKHDSTYEWIDDSKARTRVQAFSFLNSKTSFIEAKKRFSIGRNFDRDIGQFIEAVPLINIQELTYNRLHRMFDTPSSVYAGQPAL